MTDASASNSTSGPSGPDDTEFDDAQPASAASLEPDVPEDDFAADIAALIEGGAVSDEQAGYGSCEEALEDAVTSLERVTAERDEYLELARRVQAEFENYRKRVDSQRSEHIARAAESLIVELLPVLDACDAAVAHGATDVEPVLASLSATLVKQGLAKDEEVEVAFDPTQHEAVLSEPGEGGEDGPVVAEVLRAGYLWNGRVLRPAMVKVRG